MGKTSCDEEVELPGLSPWASRTGTSSQRLHRVSMLPSTILRQTERRIRDSEEGSLSSIRDQTHQKHFAVVDADEKITFCDVFRAFYIFGRLCGKFFLVTKGSTRRMVRDNH